MKYAEALDFIYSCDDFAKKHSFDMHKSFKPDRMYHILRLLHDPQKKYKSIVIGGTNGKGSTAAILHALLSGSGYRVGVFTSPHLIDIRERIRINDILISKNNFAKIVARIHAIIETKWDAERFGGALTFFEIVTVVAMVYFFEQHVEIALFEVGLGGRLDATNILVPLFSIITSISKDHEHILGSSLRAIAREKAGIIKEKSYVISARQRPTVRQVLLEQSRRVQAQVYAYKEDFDVAHAAVRKDGWCVSFAAWRDLRIPLYADCQLENSALALQALWLLHRKYGFNVSLSGMKQALRMMRWPGRFEIVSENPVIVLDGAHNVASMHELQISMQRRFPRKTVIVICGFSADKAIHKMIGCVSAMSDSVVVTHSGHNRALMPADFSSLAKRYGVVARETASIDEAFDVAVSLSDRRSVIVVTGSLFLVGEAKRYMIKKKRFQRCFK